MRILILPTFLLFFVQSILAQGAGQTGLAFLKLGIGSRALAMGEAYSADASDPSAVYYNPASLSLSKSTQIMLMHREWIQDTKTEFLGAQSAVDRFAYGIGINSTSVDNIEVREVPGPPEATFSARNVAMGISAAYEIYPSLSIGVTGNFLYEKMLVNEASGYGLNFGALYQMPSNVRFAMSVSNLGSMSELDQASSKLPATLRLGASYHTPLEAIEGDATTSVDVVSVSEDNTPHIHFGGELSYKETFAIRAGYQTGYETKNFSAGFGVRYGMFQLDYAFVPVQLDLGSTHTFSLGINFR